MLEPGTKVRERLTGKTMVVLPPRNGEGDRVVLLEAEGTYGWCGRKEEELEVIGRVVVDPEPIPCSGCLFFTPARLSGQEADCVRHSPERWKRIPFGDAGKAKGKGFPVRLYPECKDPKSRTKIP